MKIIRKRIGFQGLLMSDDLDMHALQYALNGGLKERAEAALGAGCDVVLQCSGKLKEMQLTAEGLPPARRPLAGSRPRRRILRKTPAARIRRRCGVGFKELLNWATKQSLRAALEFSAGLRSIAP
jgi:beta-glucosidase-like glycosyl hydrolase